MKTIAKRRFTNGAATKNARTKTGHFGASLYAKWKTVGTKKVLTRCNRNSTALCRISHHGLRRAFGYMVNDNQDRDQPELMEGDVQSEDNCEPEEFDFVTYDSAPKVNRLERVVEFIKLWSTQLPAGFERLVCIMMAIFLFLSIMSVQIYIGILQKYQIRSRVAVCSKPSTPTEVITFECQVMLQFLAWIMSMLLALFIMACHLLYSSLIYIWHTSHTELSVQPQEDSNSKNWEKQLDSIVTDNGNAIHSGLEEKKDN